jgi:hypothetical protein
VSPSKAKWRNTKEHRIRDEEAQGTVMCKPEGTRADKKNKRHFREDKAGEVQVIEHASVGAGQRH